MRATPIPKDFSASAISLQHCPKGGRGFISPENIWEDERVEFVGRVV